LSAGWRRGVSFLDRGEVDKQPPARGRNGRIRIQAMSGFDEIVDRHNTSSYKWERYKDRDVISMWVADMDFQSPPAVRKMLREKIDYGVFGYTMTPHELNEVTVAMLEREYGWRAETEWLDWLPGVVPGLHTSCRTLTGDNDAVLTATPVFFRFFEAQTFANRQTVKVPLACDDKLHYTLDYDALEAAMTPEVKVFQLCNPHNPVGRCYRRDELERLAEICLRHDLYVVSDEIHCGLVLDEDRRHVPFASLSPEVAARTITLYSPSKTYNTPGLNCGFAVIPDPELHARFRRVMRGMIHGVNQMGYYAALAAYRDCGDWLRELKQYLRGNRDLLEKTVRGLGLSMPHVEATYLGWIDIRALGLEQPVTYFEEHGLGFNNGADFGQPGFVRINFACPRPQLRKALERFSAAVAAAGKR